MVVDTALRARDEEGSTARPLDADRFPFGYVVEPRSRPIAVEGTLCHGTDGAIYFANGDVAGRDDPMDDHLVQWMKSSTDNGRTWGEK